MGGKPCVRGMRVTVGMIVGLVASGHPWLSPMLPGASRKSKCRSRQHEAPDRYELEPLWVKLLAGAGVDSIHWSDIGRSAAADGEIMDYAGANGLVIFTHDLDFGALLAS